MSSEKQIPFAKPDITKEDIEAVKNVLENQDQLTDGEQCRNFESEFSLFISKNSTHLAKYSRKLNVNLQNKTCLEIGDGYCLTTSSCMAALHLSYLALGIGEGDEVICPAISHVATAHAIELVGATPVFMDCGYYGNFDVFNVEKYITRKTKAITLVHFLGEPCSMIKIMDIARDYDLRVIEDCALSLGSQVKGNGGGHVGLFGDTGCFSFYPAKHITTGEGGMFVAKDLDVYTKAKSITSFGKVSSDQYLYDMKYLGSNFRMDEMSAALGRSQLKRFDKNLKIREKNCEVYAEYLNHSSSYYDHFASNSYAVSVRIKNENRDEVMIRLKQKGIGCSIYYPHPLPRLAYYRKKYGYQRKRFPNAINIADNTIALPVGVHVSEEDIKYIIGVLNE